MTDVLRTYILTFITRSWSISNCHEHFWACT